jgi:glycerol-3-phosphate dehydrogenase
MAEDVMETAIQRQLLRAAPCRTADLPLHGATNMPNDLPPSGTGSPDRYYGADLPLVQAMPGADNVLVPASGLTEAHVRFAARYELARRVEDVLARRNRALFLDAALRRTAPRVAAILAEELAHDSAWQARELEDFGKLARGYMLG